jgi:MoaD family protein
MAVDVVVTSTLQKITGAKSVRGEGTTVGALLDDLDQRFPGFRAQISASDGQLHRFVNIYLNDEDIRYLQALDTPLKEGDVISILPALAGGAGARPQPEGGGMQGVSYAPACWVGHAPPFRVG